MASARKFSFPVFHRLEIKHFSLYKKTDYLDIDLRKKVFCLAGANGLGKSTFITILNYALTGIVKHPERQFTSFNSIPAFYNRSKTFADGYFDGRVKEDDHELAEVTVHFSVDGNDYKITRGFFEVDELRDFEYRPGNKKGKVSANTSPGDLHESYKTRLTKDIGLSDFDQFVFLQFYVFTFDETHQLVSWDVSLIERILHLFFGVDASKAKLADQLRKEYNKYDSDVRNLQYQITRTRSELESVKKKIKTVDENDPVNIQLLTRYKGLIEKRDELSGKIDEINDGIKEADVHIADLSLKASSLRNEYSNIFNKTLSDGTPIEKNPAIVEVLNDLMLRIHANRQFTDLIDKLVVTIRQHRSNTGQKTNKQYFDQLKKIDEQLSKFTSDIRSFQTRKDRLVTEENVHSLQLKEISDKIGKIEEDNADVLKVLQQSDSDTLDIIVKSYQDQIERLTSQKDEAYKKRNRAKKELEPLEDELNLGYINAEKEFIPKFNEYAKSFLGLDITIALAMSTKGASLLIDIEDAKRKVAFQLSESQRYFVDIALRMALIDLCTHSATILIDTPEGSLDIAYESRAGVMFAGFSKGDHKLIMTANINSSQLLLELAGICKASKMKIERMTEWTELSDVQQDESSKIEKAFAKIEKTLNT